MFELTIDGVVYQFKFGLGFAREISKTRKVKGENGEAQDMGLQFAVASLIDEDPVALVDILDLANKTENPRVTRAMLDRYIEDENTNITQIFAELLDFFERNNSTKKATENMKKFVEEQRKKAEAEIN